MANPPPVLIGCSHGTRSAAGRRVIGELRLAIGALRPGLPVVAAQVDVHKPALPDVVARLRDAGTPMVIVPLLLSAGFHVGVDVAQAAALAPGLAVAAAPLGPAPVLAQILDQRLHEAGAGDGDAIVVAAAGSSDPVAAAAVEAVAGLLAELRGVRVLAGYGAGASPSVPEAVVKARAAGRRVSIAAYLLAPGHFAAQLDQAGADLVTAPLGAHPQLARLALQRYDEALNHGGCPTLTG